MSRTTTTTVSITCPHWCRIEPQAHADDLWNQGGVLVHHMPEIRINDAGGFEQAGSDTLPAAEFSIGMTSLSTPGGRLQGSSVIYLDGHEVTVDQAEQIAAALLEVIALAKAP
ncbi:hypothetical protein EUA93_18840 [Nocardioides oleivorans]|uniref:Uncharacterized protein n=1 Tax=Nocardioides oleivorans TaxID=273676 RepID=A0A4Q2RU90_9ACTN|nr:hypothetical protein [Nocardioides oleivorans]RYB90993.1 hypothetical protein EUA93_18840 [Nocardioides oleivorans]